METPTAPAPPSPYSSDAPAPDATAAAFGPQAEGGNCTCGGASKPAESPTPSYVYALGQMEPRFPSLAVEKEFAQATSRADAKGLSDRQAFQAVISKKENRYLARQVCYVLTVGGVEAYLLRPRDPADLNLLVEAIRPNPRPTNIDVVIGIRGPLAPPELCNGLVVPMVGFDQIYSFDTDALIKAVPRPGKITVEKFGPIAEEVFARIMQMTDNAGATDEHRALNYLAVRDPAVYATAAEAFGRNCSLTAVDVPAAPLAGGRKRVDVVFSFVHRETGVIEKHAVRVDVTEEFPFLVSKLAPYYDR